MRESDGLLRYDQIVARTIGPLWRHMNITCKKCGYKIGLKNFFTQKKRAARLKTVIECPSCHSTMVTTASELKTGMLSIAISGIFYLTIYAFEGVLGDSMTTFGEMLLTIVSLQATSYFLFWLILLKTTDFILVYPLDPRYQPAKMKWI